MKRKLDLAEILRITKDKLLPRYINSLVDLTVFGLIIAVSYTAYRIRIWFFIKEMFKDLSELSFGAYIILCARTDALMLLFSLGVLLCLFISINRAVLRYAAASVFTVASAICLLIGTVVFNIYETTMQKSLLTEEIASEWTSIIKSMMSEVSISFFIAILLITGSVIASSLILAKRKKKVTSAYSILKTAWPVVVTILLLLCIILTGKESQLYDTAKSITSMNEKQAYATLREISMNPNYNILFEQNYNKKQPIRNENITSENFSFGLNTDSLETHRRKERINILPRGKNYNIIVYLFESTHSKRVDMKINERFVTPVWQRLMNNSIRAKNHYANYPLSANALLSVLSSAYGHPGRKLIIQNYPKIPLKTIPEILRDKGYNSFLIHSGNLKYVNQIEFLRDRFDKITDYAKLSSRRPYNYDVGWGLDERAMTEPVIEFINECKGKPFFITMMPVNPHHPYSIPEKDAAEAEAFRIAGNANFSMSRREKNVINYLNSLHYADAALGQLIDSLEANGMMENTLLFLLADHGEAFYEHKGNYNHPFFLYEENVHVPFVIYNKGLIPHPIDIHGITRHIDILPTIMDLLDIKTTPEQDGVSILSGGREQLAVLHTNWKYDFLGVRDAKWKYIRRMSDSFEELYDLDSDPLETNNLSTMYPDIIKRYNEFTDKSRTYSTAYYEHVLAGIRSNNHKSIFDIDEITFEEYQELQSKKNPKENH